MLGLKIEIRLCDMLHWECLADRIMWRADATMHVEADWPWRLKRRTSRLNAI
jgi:hypothetical protein